MPVESSLTADLPDQHEMFGRAPLLKALPICREIIVRGDGAARAMAFVAQPPTAAPTATDEQSSIAAAQVRYIKQMHYASMERIARTPIVPTAWLKSTLQITAEDAGDHKAGRPKVDVRKRLSMNDLDNSIVYIQRRTRELQKLVRGTQPSEAHTNKIVSSVIKDAIRKLCVNLPDEKRVAIDEVVASL